MSPVNNKTQKVKTVLRTITIHAKRQPLMHFARHRTPMENCNPDTHFAEIVWANQKGPCPECRKECRKCLKYNHFARVCRSSRQGRSEGPTQRRDKTNIQPLNTSNSNDNSQPED